MWKFHRLSISLRLRRFFLRVNSVLTPRQRQQQQQKQTLKSKLLAFFKRFRIHRKKNRDSSRIAVNKHRYPAAESYATRLKRFAYEELMFAGALVNGALAFLPQSITVSSLVILLLLMVAAFTTPSVFYFNNHLQYYCRKYVWEYIRGMFSTMQLL